MSDNPREQHDDYRLTDRGRYVDRFDLIDAALLEHMEDEEKVWDELRQGQTDLGAKVTSLSVGLQAFVDQHRALMLGEEKLENGSGILSEIREIKKTLKESPSLLAIAKAHPVRFMAAIGAAIATGLAVWFGVHIFAHLPGVEAYFSILLNLPPTSIP